MSPSRVAVLLRSLAHTRARSTRWVPGSLRAGFCSDSAATPSGPTLTLFTKQQCCLCDGVKFIIDKVKNKRTFNFEEVDISLPENAKWHELYQYDIPVLHMNGKEIFRYRVSEKQLLEVLPQ